MNVEGNYTNAVSETSKVNKVPAAYQQETKADYSNYSLKQIREIPYEEAKANYPLIKERMDEIHNTRSKEGDVPYISVASQLAEIHYSNNEQLNKAKYEYKQNLEEPLDTLVFDLNFQINAQDYYHGKDIHASFVKGNGYEELHSNKPLTKAQINSINFSDFISKMLETFTKDANSTQGEVKEQFQGLVDMYSSLQTTYEKEVRTPYYA